VIAVWASLLIWAADPPVIEASTLDGRSVAGPLQSLDGNALVIARESGPVRIPTTDLLDVRTTAASAPASSGDALQVVVLQDGSRFRCRSLSVKGQTLSVEHPEWGNLGVPIAQVRTLQFAADDPALSAAWKQLAERPTKKDLAVIRKGDVLDHLDGVVGDIDDTTVNFLLDGEPIGIKRDRMFGIVYSRKDAPASSEGVRIEFANGDALQVRQVTWGEGQWRLGRAGTQQFPVAGSAVLRLDYSQGKVVYLSSLEPRDVKYTPYFDYVVEYQRDRGVWGGPLRVGGRTYARGLAIHSKTVLRYRLGGDYRRFTAVLGMDPEVKFDATHPESRREARVEVRGDGRLLFGEDVKAGEAPRNLDLPIDGVGDLEILVDFGRDNLDIGDRIHFGEAKVIK